MVIHCSAGVGRSGTFIVIDYSLLRMRQENKVDIFNLIKELRMQRPYMVQSEEQYIFCHNAVLEEILCGDTSIKASDLSDHISELDICDPNTEKTGFQKQLELLDKVSPGRQKFSYGGGMKSSNASKNRSSSCIPPDESRVVLDMIPEVSDDSTYICASAVDVGSGPFFVI
jgi:netrin-G3 ligand